MKGLPDDAEHAVRTGNPRTPTRFGGPNGALLFPTGPDTEQRPAMLTVSVQEYDIADVRPVFGKGRRANLQHGATLGR